MSNRSKSNPVTPVKTGVQQWRQGEPRSLFWIPAFAGMTVLSRELFE
jgi:hypothetical protein